MSKSSKVILIILISAVLILSSILFVILDSILTFIDIVKWPNIASDFNEYKGDYTRVAEYCRDFFENNYFEKEDDMYLFCERDGLYYEGEALELSDDIKDSVANLGKAFGQEGISIYSIHYEGDRLRFSIEAGYYALVYSFDGKKPTYLHRPGEDILVKRIDKNWYHVTVNSY